MLAVYKSMRYIKSVQDMANYECSAAIEEIKDTDSYKEKGEVSHDDVNVFNKEG